MGRLWSEKNRPPDLDQVVDRMRKRFKGEISATVREVR